MTQTEILLLGTAAVLVVVVVFILRSGRMKFGLDTYFGKVNAEGRERAKKTVPSGVNISGVKAGRDITVTSKAEGGVTVTKTTAVGDLNAKHLPPDA